MQLDSTCSFPNCERPRMAKGLCNGHYKQHLLGEELRPLRKPKPRGQPYLACLFPDCERPRKSKGFCEAHRNQQRLGQQLRQIVFQKQKGAPPRIICDEAMCPVPGLIGPCHIFRATKGKNVYGTVRVGGGQVGVHRYIWEKENGPIPDGLEIDHQCRVRPCCNGDHLRAVTPKVNSTENVVGAAWQIAKEKTHCLRGHPFDAENTFWKGNHRKCKECRHMHSRLNSRARRLKLKGVVA